MVYSAIDVSGISRKWRKLGGPEVKKLGEPFLNGRSLKLNDRIQKIILPFCVVLHAFLLIN